MASEEERKMDTVINNVLADDMFEDVFMFLDFAKHCQFRRVCRRWDRLLRSPLVLQTIIFDVPASRATDDGFEMEKLDSENPRVKVDLAALTRAYQAIVPHVQNVLFIRDYLQPSADPTTIKNPDQCDYVADVAAMLGDNSNKRRYAGSDVTSGAHPLRKIVLAGLWTGLDIAEGAMLAGRACGNAVVELRNCQFRGCRTYLTFIREWKGWETKVAWEKLCFYVRGTHRVSTKLRKHFDVPGICVSRFHKQNVGACAAESSSQLSSQEVGALERTIAGMSEENLESFLGFLRKFHDKCYADHKLWDVDLGSEEAIRQLKIDSLAPFARQLIHFHVRHLMGLSE